MHGSALRQETLGVFPTQVNLAPQNTLESLSSIECRITISALVTLIDHFPSLVCVELMGLKHEADNELTPPLARLLQKLFISKPDTDNALGIVDQLLELHQNCDKVTLSVRGYCAPFPMQRIIGGVWTTVKRLNLDTGVSCECRVKTLPRELFYRTLKLNRRSEGTFDNCELPESHVGGRYLDHRLPPHSKYYVR